jgi:hypothetical protein
MKLGLIITNDWEVFGDGSGDYFELQHKPLEALLKVMAEHDAKLTVMAEVGQQWAHQNIVEQEPWAHEIVVAWESMLKDTVRRQFDVQLHLHPQWLDAKYVNNRWQLNLSEWSIGALPPSALGAILRKAKSYLDNLLQPVCPSYECLAFRAGAYCIEPSQHVIEALLDTGIICDSSVTKGLYNPPFFDYRDAFSCFMPWFTSSEDVKYQSDSTRGLLEIPVCSYQTFDSPILRKLVSPQLFYWLFLGVHITQDDRQWLEKRSQDKLQKYPLSKRPFFLEKIKSIRWIFSNLLSKTALQLDYDSLPPKVFVKFLQAVLEKGQMAGLEGVTLPVVASGHTKDMCGTENVARILQAVHTALQGRVVYWTLREAIQSWTTFLTEHPPLSDYKDH